MDYNVSMKPIELTRIYGERIITRVERTFCSL